MEANQDLIMALLPMLILLVNVLGQILSYRFSTKIGLFKSVIVGYLIGCLGLLMMLTLLADQLDFSSMDSLGKLLLSFINYTLMAYCYFHFINMGETARRIRLVRELEEHTEGMTKLELIQRYNAKEMVNRRLQRMIKKHQIECRDGRYFIKDKTLLRITLAIVFIKKFLTNSIAGFDHDIKK